MAVADGLLKPAGGHARKHHAESHESGAYGIMRGLVLAVAEIDKVEHIGRETESVAELLDEHTQVYGEQRVGGPIAEIDECKTCQGHAPRHGPQPLFQAAARSHDAAHDAAYGKTDYAYGAVDESHLACASFRNG